jgi:outer membrane protein OmpA-like peptidoglycan-associated protein/tetratricopeptide (TPR) repeat protein
MLRCIALIFQTDLHKLQNPQPKSNRMIKATALKQLNQWYRICLATCFVLSVTNLAVYGQGARRLFAEANKSFAGGEYATALPQYLDGLELEPENPSANFYAGVCFLKTVHKRRALPYLQKAYKKNPAIDPKMEYLMGEAYQCNNQFEEAIVSYRLYKQNYQGKDPKEMEKVEKRLQECANGIKYTKEPVNAKIDNIGSVINSQYPDYAPVISSDESVMFFTSRREGSTGNFVTVEDGMHYEDIYVSFHRNGTWTQPRNMGATINTTYHDACIAVSPDGKQLFIYKDTKSGDIYSSTLIDSAAYQWSKPVSLGDNINSKYQEPSVSMTADGKTLFFSSDRPGGKGGLDIYYSRKTSDGKWGEAINLGDAINTPYDDDAPFIHPDGQTLYFSSRGHATMGGYDIFRCYFENDQWTTPENLGYPINTVDDDSYFVLSADNNHGYYASANEGGHGEKDIYVISMPKREDVRDAVVTELKVTPRIMAPVAAKTQEIKPVEVRTPTTILKGVVLDALTKDSLEARVVLTDNVMNEVVADIQSEPGTGKYTIVMPSGKNYGLAVEKGGYLFHSENYDIPASTGYQEIDLNVELKKIAVGSRIVLKNIFFDLNKATLKKESTAELQNLLELLNESPKLKIEISGHTDNKGVAANNMTLSQKRAKSVVDYLVANGVAPTRLKSAGYGATKPLATNQTEEGRQMNRRTEFKIIAN